MQENTRAQVCYFLPLTKKEEEELKEKTSPSNGERNAYSQIEWLISVHGIFAERARALTYTFMVGCHFRLCVYVCLDNNEQLPCTMYATKHSNLTLFL